MRKYKADSFNKKLAIMLADFDDFLARHNIYLSKDEYKPNIICRLSYWLYFKK